MAREKASQADQTLHQGAGASGASRGPHGPGGPRGARGPRPKIENPGRLLKRVLGYTFKDYAVHWIVVVVCIVTTVLATLQGTLFMRTLIDDYIVPLLGQQNPDFGPLAGAIGRVACFYGLGVLASFTQSRLMIYVTQGTMKNLRDDLFEKMEELPIRYFDTHAHGDIMSIYTNDIDTMRQMVSQSVPQLASSAISVVSTLVSMLVLDIPLTLVTLFMVAVMILAARKVGSLSGRFFLAQQRDLGDINGYIEEMIEGQKVIKVFNHESQAKAGFDARNDRYRRSAASAHAFAADPMDAIRLLSSTTINFHG